MPRTKASHSPKQVGDKAVFSTTEGRKHFPDFIQESYGSKSIVGFDRYGRFLGAIVPPEAILMLAGGTAEADMDEHTVARIRKHAQHLIAELDHRNEVAENDVALTMDEIKNHRDGQTPQN